MNEENTTAGESKSAVTEEEASVTCNSVPGEPGASPTEKSEGKVQNETKRTKSGKPKGVDLFQYCAV